ncbi:MAG: hypothetical protein BJ554DRAFT_2014, partial [Olpidium bornovanus]
LTAGAEGARAPFCPHFLRASPTPLAARPLSPGTHTRSTHALPCVRRRPRPPLPTGEPGRDPTPARPHAPQAAVLRRVRRGGPARHQARDRKDRRGGEEEEEGRRGAGRRRRRRRAGAGVGAGGAGGAAAAAAGGAPPPPPV